MEPSMGFEYPCANQISPLLHNMDIPFLGLYYVWLPAIHAQHRTATSPYYVLFESHPMGSGCHSSWDAIGLQGLDSLSASNCQRIQLVLRNMDIQFLGFYCLS